ncbi:MAG: hypothetical protein M1838_004826, partial [Thelocarpon superellum]
MDRFQKLTIGGPSSTSGPSNTLPFEVQESLRHLQDFFDRVTATKCYKCNAARVTVEANVVDTAAGMLDWCCDQGRLFAIWLLLARYDQVELITQENTAVKLEEAARARQRAGPRRSKGKGYEDGGSFSEGMFQFDEDGLPMRPRGRSRRSIDFQSSDHLTDGLLTSLLSLLCELVPRRSRNKTSAFDESPPPTLLAALKLSLFTDKLGELWRNDSVADVGARQAVYAPALKFVHTLAGHPSTRHVITRERYATRLSPGLLALSTRNGPSLELNNPREGQAPAVIARLENLNRQSEIMIQIAGT